MSQPIRGRDGHLVFRINPKNTNLIEDVEIFLPVKFLNSVKGVQRRSRKCLSKSETGAVILSSCFSIDPKTINLVGGVEILLPVKFRWIRFSGFRGEIENFPCQSEIRAAILSARKTQTRWRTLRSCFLSSYVEFRSAVAEKSKFTQDDGYWMGDGRRAMTMARLILRVRWAKTNPKLYM